MQAANTALLAAGLADNHREEGNSMFLRNVGKLLPDYTVSRLIL
jgi:hypothetical protein